MPTKPTVAGRMSAAVSSDEVRSHNGRRSAVDRTNRNGAPHGEPFSENGDSNKNGAVHEGNGAPQRAADSKHASVDANSKPLPDDVDSKSAHVPAPSPAPQTPAPTPPSNSARWEIPDAARVSVPMHLIQIIVERDADKQPVNSAATRLSAARVLASLDALNARLELDDPPHAGHDEPTFPFTLDERRQRIDAIIAELAGFVDGPAVSEALGLAASGDSGESRPGDVARPVETDAAPGASEPRAHGDGGGAP